MGLFSVRTIQDLKMEVKRYEKKRYELKLMAQAVPKPVAHDYRTDSKPLH